MAAAHGRRVICHSRELVERGHSVRFNVSRHGEVVPAFAVRFNGRVHAYLNQCAHRSLELDWNDGDFFDAFGEHLLCATHGRAMRPPAECAWAGRLPSEAKLLRREYAGTPQATTFIESPGRHRRKSMRLGRWRPLRRSRAGEAAGIRGRRRRLFRGGG
ncbi:Rieske (2Fe-2S) protein [Sulfuricaulis sp.]|uniref:Rieske (2Fe-2S) protein n=1 Tax=Sulfuricaulis sp. TaxID=2003553 RepID=UPI003C771C71